VKRTPNRRRAEFLIQLTAQERDLLIAHVHPPGALDRILGAGRSKGPIVSLELADEEASEFCWLVEQTVNFAQNGTAQRRLDHLVARLEAGFTGNVDPGAHLVRPGACRLGYSAKQGQYLAFIHCYETLHRRPPAEADLREYFRVSPPAVHEMLRTLERRKFIVRALGEPRSIRLLLRPEQIPALEYGRDQREQSRTWVTVKSQDIGDR
jgi:hypothetical protein